ncbi:glycosyltransferase family 2 protein [Pseudomonas guariconensis]|uniref:glycosyltransferase family 2 protein n=1 Tax=Pseudomonas guariconensis TaxID=1288410 RepID=UPI0039EB6CC0
MIRELFSKRPQPYYIYAPDYRRSSAGIRVMHMLCDALNRSGQEAYVVCRTLNPALITPRLTDEIIALHKSHGLEPIVVYPEVIDGNPFGGKTVVRYLLNKPGHLGGRGEYGKDDLFFVYMRGLLQPGVPEQNILYCPAIDLSIFRPPLDASKRVPGKVCYYQGRGGQAKVDPALLPPDAVEITPTFPGSWEELAGLFQECEYLYLGERSGLAAEAVLCGCVCIVIPGQWAPEPLSLSENNSYGTAWGNSPDAVQRARETVHLLRERQVQHQADFWRALDHFIEVTQEAAERMAAADRFGRLSWLHERRPTPPQLAMMNQRLADQRSPALAVLILNLGTDPVELQRTLTSLERSLHTPSQLYVLGGEYHEDPRAHWVAVDEARMASTINAVVQQATCDWLLLVEAGVEFTESGLLITALDLLDVPDECLAVYADEALRLEGGVIDVHLRPDLNLDLLLSLPADQSRHWLYRRESLLRHDGFSTQCGGGFELAYQLRLIEQHGLSCIGHINEPLLISEGARREHHPDERGVIEDHLRVRGYLQAQAIPQANGGYRISYGHGHQPLVSILIYLEGRLAHFQRCVESLLEHTRYTHYEIVLVVPGTDDEATIEWLAMLEQVGMPRIRVLHFHSGATRGQLCNVAAQHANGEFLLWLDAGVGVFDGDWLQQLLNHAQRPEIGAVGAKLLTGNAKVHHAGLVLGLGGTVGRAFEGSSCQSDGYMKRLQVDQNFSALGGECLMVPRALFIEVGGFEEGPLLAPWADVDLCLKLQQAGYLNVWTPYAQLLMGAVERPEVTPEQEDALYARWLARLVCDPAYNLNLSLQRDHAFTPAPNALVWRPSRGDVPTVLAYVADAQGGELSRVVEPFTRLREARVIDGLVTSTPLSIVELARFAPDTVVLQRPLDDGALQLARRLSTFSQAFKVYDLDGCLSKMQCSDGYEIDEIMQRLRFGVMQVDRVLVTTPALAELVQGHCDDVRILESALPTSWRNLQGQRRISEKPRVGWVGTVEAGILLAEVVPVLAAEVDWVVLGDCPVQLHPYMKERYAAVAPEALGTALAALNLDLALAPMVESMVNACSGSLRLLQHAACGHPIICSRVAGFVGADVLPLSRADNRADDWVRVIRMHLDDRDASAALGDALQAVVHADWLFEGNRLASWHQAWQA